MRKIEVGRAGEAGYVFWELRWVLDRDVADIEQDLAERVKNMVPGAEVSYVCPPDTCDTVYKTWVKFMGNVFDLDGVARRISGAWSGGAGGLTGDELDMVVGVEAGAVARRILAGRLEPSQAGPFD